MLTVTVSWPRGVCPRPCVSYFAGWYHIATRRWLRIAQVLAQGGALVAGPEQPAALQFRHHQTAEFLEHAGIDRRPEDEPVGRAVGKPVLHLVGDGCRGADQHVAPPTCRCGETDPLGARE